MQIYQSFYVPCESWRFLENSETQWDALWHSGGSKPAGSVPASWDQLWFVVRDCSQHTGWEGTGTLRSAEIEGTWSSLQCTAVELQQERSTNKGTFRNTTQVNDGSCILQPPRGQGVQQEEGMQEQRQSPVSNWLEAQEGVELSLAQQISFPNLFWCRISVQVGSSG